MEFDPKSFTGDLNQGFDAGAQPQQVNETPEMTPPQVEPQPQADQAQNWQALREEISRIKAEKDELARAFSSMQLQNRPPPEPPKPMFEGLQDTEVPNVGELRREWGNREKAYSAQLEELKVAASHPDYRDVIQKYTAPLVTENPYLLDGIQNSPNMALAAYKMGKMQQRIQELEAQPSPTAQRIMQNANAPRQVGASMGMTKISEADKYATMSDADFIKLASQYLN